MGYQKYMKQLWKSPQQKEIIKERLISWRKEPVILKLERPTRLDRAHALGYKAKQGFVVARVKIGKGSSKREKMSGGRKPIHAGQTQMNPKMNAQHIAEMRVNKKFPNMEVLNSYYVAEDGKKKWFEVILVDPQHPCIKKDKKLNWVCETKGRSYRGLTSSGKKSRALMRGFERRNKPGKKQ
ncbi:MAG: 50S ribosomal protein L15e [Candidatus Aenigmarchaeota archaeon]|nr:50S ribosomal protein L15e [Candidatus Aenigmarchaeota archaeon]